MDLGRPYTEPVACLGCNTVHNQKTYHLTVDDAGAVVVSPGVWQASRAALEAAGFTVADTVIRPPNQHLALGGASPNGSKPLEVMPWQTVSSTTS